MARTTLTKTAVVGPYPTLQPTADSLDITWTAADTVNFNQFKPTGKDIILVWNSGASPYTFTLTSKVDPQNRTGDITAYSLAAADIMAFKVDNLTGWLQSDGYVYLQASNAAVKFGILSF